MDNLDEKKLKDKKQLAAFPNVFIHMERLLDDGEYSRDCLWQLSSGVQSYFSGWLQLSAGFKSGHHLPFNISECAKWIQICNLLEVRKIHVLRIYLCSSIWRVVLDILFKSYLLLEEYKINHWKQ